MPEREEDGVRENEVLRRPFDRDLPSPAVRCEVSQNGEPFDRTRRLLSDQSSLARLPGESSGSRPQGVVGYAVLGEKLTQLLLHPSVGFHHAS